jgi:hypothetical protein
VRQAHGRQELGMNGEHSVRKVREQAPMDLKAPGPWILGSLMDDIDTQIVTRPIGPRIYPLPS